MRLKFATSHADGVKPASGCALTCACRRRRAVVLDIARSALPAAPDAQR
jgi:hypothetical protein